MLELETWTDISRYQNSSPGSNTLQPINFGQMQDQGVVGVCIRKTIGRYHDPAFELNWHHAGMVGLKRTVYCVPYVAYDMSRQQRAMTEWSSGGLFDGVCDIPAWDDVERKHKLSRSGAVSRLLPYHYAMVDTFGAAEFYTAKYVWNDFYSRAHGWQKDWGLVIASYTPSLYHLPITDLKGRVAQQIIHPAVPMGWLYNPNGNQIPSSERWEQWQISADGNKLGEQYGVHSRDIDISFRQGLLKPAPAPDSFLQEKVIDLRELFGRMDDQLADIEEELFV